MSASLRVVVIGASGFVGSATTRVLEQKGIPVKRVVSPRLPGMMPAEAITYIESEPLELAELAAQLQDVDMVVNAAGLPDATSTDFAALVAANGVLPGLIAAACVRARVRRLVHVSSAAVQGRLPVLDESNAVDAFSKYSESKLLGEQMVSKFSSGTAVTYRPPGVHGIDRRVTQLVARIAAGPFASVAKPGASPSPQALINNVAEAIAFLATTSLTPPAVVIHPWEGLTTTDVMELLGGRAPLRVSKPIARAVVGTLALTGNVVPRMAGTARRVEMLWFGQRQAVSWLSTVGWIPPCGRAEWAELGHAIRARMQSHQSPGGTR